MESAAILINVFEVTANCENEFFHWWQRSAEVLQHEPGFIDTQLHRSVTANARFQFINISRWETTGSLERAREKNRDILSCTVGKGNPAFYYIQSQYERHEHSIEQPLNKMRVSDTCL